MTTPAKNKEHGLPLVRWQRRRRGTVLRRHLSRLVCRHSAPRTGGLSVREERGCVDGLVHHNGHSVPRAQRWIRVQAQRGVLVSGRNRRSGRNGSLLERDRRQRRPVECVRVVQGQMGVVLADHASGTDGSDLRSRPHCRQARVRCDDDNAKD